MGERGDNPVAWLSLDSEDGDPNRFWRYVAAALDRVVPQLEERIGSLPDGVHANSSDDLVVAVVNALETLQHEVVLVLDDYHTIESSAVHESMTFVLERPDVEHGTKYRTVQPGPRDRGDVDILTSPSIPPATDERAMFGVSSATATVAFEGHLRSVPGSGTFG